MCMNKVLASKIYESGKSATIVKLIELDSKIDAFLELTSQQKEQIEILNDRIARYEKNSSNSSKPPSSDIVKPQGNRSERRKKGKKRKKGGQEKHPKWECTPFSPDEVKPIDYTLLTCPDCGTTLQKKAKKPPKILQQITLPSVVVEKIEHRGNAYWCPHCKSYHYAEIPSSVQKEGLFKPDVSAVVCFLKFVGCMSFKAIKRYLKDVMGVKVTKGYLAKVIQKASQSLEVPYRELFQYISKQAVVNSDETGHKNNGKKCWTWVFRSNLCALFKVSPSRGSQVLIEVLGKEFNGVLGCDYFSAYHKYMKDFDIQLQFCIAHLIRDVKFLAEYHEKSVQEYGKGILKEIRKLFHTIHNRDTMSQADFTEKLERCKAAIIKAGTTDVPDKNVCNNMAKRFLENGSSYFTFITTPEVDPTNNCAEQAIRFVVIYRKVSQGTRSINGMIACERFFTVVATCSYQARSAYEFIRDSIAAYCTGKTGPSLIPAINSV